MFSHIRRSVLLATGAAVLALASPLAFAATTGGVDTPTGVQTMPIAVEGNAILTLTDSPSNAVAVTGQLQLSGWMGIGTTTPAAPLDITIPSYPTTPAIHTYAPSVFGNIWIGGANDFTFDGGSDSYFWFNNIGAASGATAFVGNGKFNLYISNTGYVGIGTTAPTRTLDVNGYIRVRSTNGEGGTIQLDGNNGTTMWVENLNGVFRLVNSPWNAQLLSVDQSGNMGLSGSVSATAFYQTSDARLKTNIKTSKGLETISQLRGVNFDWKDGHGSSVGVLAQDVEKVIPTAVHTNADGHKTVEYSQLIGPMIESIKALQVRIDGLEIENAKLRRAIKP